jgi:hypothetical protein
MLGDAQVSCRGTTIFCRWPDANLELLYRPTDYREIEIGTAEPGLHITMNLPDVLEVLTGRRTVDLSV